MSEDDDILVIANEPPGHTDLEYNLGFGANLISFPFHGAYDINEVLPPEVIWVTTGVIGEGVGATNLNGQFVGSLDSLRGGKGYWFKLTDPITFQFINPDELTTRSNTKENKTK